MAQFRTTADVMDLALANAGEVTNGNSPYESDLLNKLNRVYHAIVSGGTVALGPGLTVEIDEVWPWARARRPMSIELVPAFETGTVTLAYGSEALTFSSAPSVSVAGWYLKVDGVEGLYRIGTHTASSTSAELECHWPDSSVGGSFRVFKLDYELIPEHILIDADNNKIDFKKTAGGSELTATLTSGVYTPAQLATHVGTQMTSAASGPTITCTYSSTTKLFTITTNGASSTTLLPLFATGSNQKFSSHKTLGFDDVDQAAALTHTGTYILGGIARLVEPIRIMRGEGQMVYGIDKESFERDYAPKDIAEGTPTKFCVYFEKDDGTQFIRFNRYPDESVRALIEYVPVPRDLKDSTGSIPVIPRKHLDVLEDAATFFVMLLKSDDRAEVYGQLVNGKLLAMLNQHRGSLLRSGNSYGKIYPRRERINGRRRNLFPSEPY